MGQTTREGPVAVSYLTIRIITYITNSARGIREEFKIVPEPGRAGPFGDCESGFPEFTKSEAGTNPGAGAGSRGLHGDEKPGREPGPARGPGLRRFPGAKPFNFCSPQLRPRATPGKSDHPARLHGVRACECFELRNSTTPSPSPLSREFVSYSGSVGLLLLVRGLVFVFISDFVSLKRDAFPP